jgi:hypothetical protein
LEEVQLQQNKLDEKTCELIEEMTRRGKTQSLELVEALERDYGIRILPHIITEYNYHKRRGIN